MITPDLVCAIYDRLVPGWQYGRREGDERIVQCPLPDHEDRRPSFAINGEKGTYYCRSRCGGGGAVDLARRLLGEDAATELLRELDDDEHRYGDQRKPRGLQPKSSPEKHTQGGKLETERPDIEDLGPPTGPQVQALVRSRRILHAGDLTGVGVRHVRVWNAEWLGIPTLDHKSWRVWGLDGNGRPRFDQKCGRTCDDAKCAHLQKLKKRTVGRISIVASPAIREALEAGIPVAGRLYDVEGESDLLASIGVGISHVVASTGGAGSVKRHERHRDQLKQLDAADVIVVRDRDRAGREGALKAAAFWHAIGAPVRVLALPDQLGLAGDLRDYLLGRPAIDDRPAMAPLGSAADLDALADQEPVRTSPDEGTDRDRGVDADADGETKVRGRKVTQAVKLVTLVGEAETELFQTPDAEPFATIINQEHTEHYALRSRAFRLWLMRLFYEETGQGPAPNALQTALGMLEARARFDGAQHTVFTRVAEHDEAIYLDLGDPAWTVIRCTANGWRMMVNPPVRFRRARGMWALPQPVGGASLEALQRFVNVATEDDFSLVVGWLVGALRPRGPYPLLALHGEQGAAKSTTARVLRALIDPAAAPLRATPTNGRDLMIAATNGWCVGFDNLSTVQPWLSDALCRLATGGGFATRELYSDSEEIIFDATRPVLLNGIEQVTTRGDLLDRTLLIDLPTIPETKRRTEADFWREFEGAHPLLLGALLDAVAGALRDLPQTHLSRAPRMADFATWVTAAEAALGWESGRFLRAYTANRRGANSVALEASPVAEVVLELLGKYDNRAWEGTATELLDTLTPIVSDRVAKSRAWPKTARSLSAVLRRLAPNLRAVGLEVTFWRATDGRRRRMLTLSPAQQSEPSEGVKDKVAYPDGSDATVPRQGNAQAQSAEGDWTQPGGPDGCVDDDHSMAFDADDWGEIA